MRKQTQGLRSFDSKAFWRFFAFWGETSQLIGERTEERPGVHIVGAGRERCEADLQVREALPIGHGLHAGASLRLPSGAAESLKWARLSRDGNQNENCHEGPLRKKLCPVLEGGKWKPKGGPP